MPRIVIPTTAPGTSDQWGFTGAPTSWEAVGHESDDSSYVSTSTAAQLSDFFCGSGWEPEVGRIMAVTVHYRIGQLDPFNSGIGSIQFTVVQNGTPRNAGSVALPAGVPWIDGEIRIREDWTSTTRFTSAEVTNLGVGVNSSVIPTNGELRVSRLWLEVEYVDSIMFYDPYDGVLPDAIAGDRSWSTSGTQSVVLTGNYLLISDSSVADWRDFTFSISDPLTFRQDYITEIEIRITVAAVAPASDVYVCRLSSSIERLAFVELVAVRLGGIQYLGLTSPLLNPLAADEYLALYQYDFEDEELHLRLKVDRDSDPSTYGQVGVYMNYDETPILQANFYDFPAPTFITTTSDFASFGTPSPGASIARAQVDYVAWKHYKKRGGVFKSWVGWEFAENTINSNTTDGDIVKPVLIDPPGITAGQSRRACELSVQRTSVICEIYQIERLPQPGPTTYKLGVVYKMDIAGVEGEVTVQRLSDLWYWNEAGSSWQSAYIAETLANQTTRTQAPVMTGMNVASAGDQIIVTVKRKTASGPAYKILVYKVYLDEE